MFVTAKLVRKPVGRVIRVSFTLHQEEALRANDSRRLILSLSFLSGRVNLEMIPTRPSSLKASKMGSNSCPLILISPKRR